MPVSKRDKKVSLTKTPKKGMKMKQQLVEEIRKNIEKYNNLFVFSFHNMRNAPLKEVREEWKDSRFFFAKKKVMAIALGRSAAEEVQKNLHKLSAQLLGQCGLLFTNRSKDEVTKWFQDYSKMDFARSGFIATETVTLPEGPLPDFQSSIEPHLRSLGLPTKLEKGTIVLREKHVVCTQGIGLTPEQASILKLLGKQLAEFKIPLLCWWSKDGSFEKFKIPKELIVTQRKIKESPKQLTELKQQENTSKQVSGKSSQGAKTPKKDKKTPKKTNNTTEPMIVEPIEKPKEDKEVENSPETEKTTPSDRKSARISRLIKKTPYRPKMSVKKLTVSAKKSIVSANKSTVPVSAKKLNKTPKQNTK